MAQSCSVVEYLPTMILLIKSLVRGALHNNSIFWRKSVLSAQKYGSRIKIVISPKTLADRLKELKIAGLIKREVFAEIPPRVEYMLTKDGAELRNAMVPLMNWASKNEKR
jgi:DNA-binding HxlR family transcriptional regulator